MSRLKDESLSIRTSAEINAVVAKPLRLLEEYLRCCASGQATTVGARIQFFEPLTLRALL
jgi:hypothetical protein